MSEDFVAKINEIAQEVVDKVVGDVIAVAQSAHFARGMLLERSAVELSKATDTRAISLASIAISLKRIADHLGTRGE